MPISIFPTESVCSFFQKYSIFSEFANESVIDSGRTSYTFPADIPGLNKIPTPPTLATQCQLPNGHQMIQSHHGTLPIYNMPQSAKILKIYSKHSYKSLLSPGQLTDSGYVFQGNSKVIILKHPDYKPLIAILEFSSRMYLLNLQHPHFQPKSISSLPRASSLQYFSDLANQE